MADKPKQRDKAAPAGAGSKELHVLDRLYATIQSRRGASPETSRTARLFQRGTAKIAQKVGEEAVEALIEGMRGKRKRLIEESADLLYHLLVLWADRNVTSKQVWAELGRREGKPDKRRKDAGA